MSKVKQYIERGGKLSKCINKCVRLRTAKVVQAGYTNRKRSRLDATGIVHGLDYLLTD